MKSFLQRAGSILVGRFFTLPGERTDYDCIFCLEPCDPKAGGPSGTFSHQEAALPTLYSHGPCMRWYSGEQMHALYLREVERRFHTGRAPHMLHA